jgi:hypothetical protein
MRALPHKQRDRHHGTTNTEPGAIATGRKLRYTQKQWTMNFGDKVFELNRAPGRYRSRF